MKGDYVTDHLTRFIFWELEFSQKQSPNQKLTAVLCSLLTQSFGMSNTNCVRVKREALLLYNLCANTSHSAHSSSFFS